MAIIVQKGDTLWDIAQRELGDGRRAKELATLNKIKNAKALKVGSSIRLPGEDNSVPLPRPRPADIHPTVTGAAEAGRAPSTEADLSPVAKAFNLPPNQTQAQEREYDPNVMHAAVMNRNEPADMAEQLDYMPPVLGSDPNAFGPELSRLDAMQPAGPPKPLFSGRRGLGQEHQFPAPVDPLNDLGNLIGSALGIPTQEEMQAPQASAPYAASEDPGAPMSPAPMGRTAIPQDQGPQPPVATLGVRGDAGAPKGVQVADASGAVPASAMPQAVTPPPGYTLDEAAPTPPPGYTLDNPDRTQAETINTMSAHPPKKTGFQLDPNMPTDQYIAREAKLGSQHALRGVADLLGSPIDAPVGLANLGVEGLNELGSLFGLNRVPLPFSPDSPLGLNAPDVAGHIANAASKFATATGAPPIPEDQQTSGEQLGGKALEYGTAAAMGGGLMPKTPEVAIPRAERPIAAAARDFGTGAGAGVGQEKASEYTDNPLLQALGSLLGAIGGKDAAAGFSGVRRGVQGLFDKFSTDKNIPINAETGKPYSQAESSLAAKAMQAAPVDRQAALSAIKENTAGLDAAGVPREAQPTTGLLSEDPGLIATERNFRMKDSPPFITRDQGVKDFAAGQVGGLRDQTVDPKLAVKGAVRADEMNQMAKRDAEALPLLKAAKDRGATVDPQPVVDLIDQELKKTKRDVVTSALTKARSKMFGQPTAKDQPPPLDTSIEGLYEARKAVNDMVAGKGDTPTDRYAQGELIAVRNALDNQMRAAAPEFGDYLDKYRAESEPLDKYAQGTMGRELMTKDPRTIVENDILGGSAWDRGDKLADVQNVISADPTAQAGFKAAVTDVLKRRVTGTKPAGSDQYEVSFAGLAKQFKDNEQTLAKVYTPEEMSTLRQAHKLLGYFKGGEARATAGSQTAENMLMSSTGDQVLAGPIGKSFELALKHVYGNLEGGGMARRFKLMVGLLPSSRYAAREIVHQAWFNPEVAGYLLGKKVRNYKAIPTTGGLRTAIMADQQGQKQQPADK